MAFFPVFRNNNLNIDELYFCGLHPNWNAVLEWRKYTAAYYEEKNWRQGDIVIPPLGYYRINHMLRWLDSHVFGSLIAASLPVRRSKDNLKQVMNNYADSIVQEMLLQFRLKKLKQLYANGNLSVKSRIDRAVVEHKNCMLIKALRYLELHNGISEWIASILNYTRNTYYPHLSREA